MGIVRKKASGSWQATRPMDDIWVRTAGKWAYPLGVWRKVSSSWQFIALGYMQPDLPVPTDRVFVTDDYTYTTRAGTARLQLSRAIGTVDYKIGLAWQSPYYLWADENGNPVQNANINSSSLRFRVTNVSGDYGPSLYWSSNVPAINTWYSLATFGADPYWELYVAKNSLKVLSAYFDVELEEENHPENAVTFSVTLALDGRF